MTISVTKTWTKYAGSGSTGPFAVRDGDDGIYFESADELIVTRIDAEGNETTLSHPADFSVSGAGSDAGSITLTDALAVGETLVIERDTAKTQTYDPTLGGSFNPDNVEAALDKLTRAVQDLSTASDQSLRLSVQDRGGSVPAVLPPVQSGHYLGWKDDGSGLENKAGAKYSLAIGTVTTGLPGTEAQAQIVPVNATQAILNLTIPRGQPGQPGPGTGDLLAANNLSDVDDAPTALANLGGQPKSDLLSSIAGLTFGADQFIYGTGPDTAAVGTISAFARTLLDDADAETARTTLGLGNAATMNEADVAAYRAGTADRPISPDTAWSAADLVPLVDAATITVDFSSGFNFTVTLGGNRTLDNPTFAKPGQVGIIEIKQDATGGRTLAFGANWKFAGGTAPSLTATANSRDILSYVVLSSTAIFATLITDVK